MERNPIKVQITKIIFEGFYFCEEYPILIGTTPESAKEISETISNLTRNDYKEVELIKDIQKLSDLIRYSFKRIYLPKPNEILFCCSSVSAKKKKEEYSKLIETIDAADSTTLSNSFHECPLAGMRNIKRENANSCPMRLKFKFYPELKAYKICEESNFNHNHSPISVSFSVNT